MKPERYKTIREEKHKQKGKLSAVKRRMLAETQKWKPINSPQLRETYSTRTEWVRKRIPKLKE